MGRIVSVPTTWEPSGVTVSGATVGHHLEYLVKMSTSAAQEFIGVMRTVSARISKVVTGVTALNLGLHGMVKPVSVRKVSR